MIVSRYVVSHQKLWRYKIETINGKSVMKLSTISHFEALTFKYEVFSRALKIDMIVIKNAPGWVSFDVMQTIGHFRVLLCLCFKTSLSAKPSI